ncbi:hypothetical protein BH10PSE17_BH10PSE17_15880 [soil metagenome]
MHTFKITPRTTAAQNAFWNNSSVESSMHYMGSVVSFLAKGTDTGGRIAAMEYQSQPGNEPPPHSHAWEHELLYVLDGEIEVYVEDKILVARVGETVFLPQGKPHAFYIRSPLLRMLVSVVAAGEHPVGLDEYFRQMASPATGMAMPANDETYQLADPEVAVRAARMNGLRILSPAEAAIELPLYPGFGFVSASALG